MLVFSALLLIPAGAPSAFAVPTNIAALAPGPCDTDLPPLEIHELGTALAGNPTPFPPDELITSSTPDKSVPLVNLFFILE